MLWLKALHIVFVVTWFAGLFYIVRLFIYHAESATLPDPDRSVLQKQYRIMERRLWYGITWPSMVLVWLTGLGYAVDLYGVQWPGWLLVKLSFVGGLTVYHIVCHRMFKRFRDGAPTYSSYFLRLWNEVTTVFLLAIVFLVVLRSSLSWTGGLVALIVIVAALVSAAWLYRKRREAHQTDPSSKK